MGKHLTLRNKEIIIKMLLSNKTAVSILKKSKISVERFIKTLKSSGKYTREVGSGRKHVLEKLAINKIKDKLKKMGKDQPKKFINQLMMMRPCRYPQKLSKGI